MPFKWSVSGGIEALSVLAGIRFGRIFSDLDAIVSAFRDGGRIAREWFGPDISFGVPRWAGISYGHANCLGSRLVFPEDSEVAHTPIYDGLSDGIRALRRDVDFTKAGLFPFYLDLWKKLEKVFPEHAISFSGFNAEGPLTTAWLLRGHAFFTDIYDDPPLAKQFLQLVTASVVKYQRLIAKINGAPDVINTSGIGLADDIAAMLPPNLWPEMVMPFLEQYYNELTTGLRSIHIEDLGPQHLHYLETLRIANYDPSVSKKLTPALIRQHCRIPFTWRLNECETAAFTPSETEHWVLDAIGQGSPAITTGVWRNNCTAVGVKNIHVFMETSQKAKELLSKGCPRNCLAELSAGRNPPSQLEKQI